VVRKWLLVATVALAVSCQSTTSGATWDQVVEVEQRDVDNVVDPMVVAANAHSATACELQARERHAKDPDAGWLILRECMRRRDYVDLLSLTEQPWKAKFRQHPELMPLVLDVLVRRNSDNVGVDLRAVGYDVHTLDTERAVVGADSDALLVARVALDTASGATFTAEQLVYDASRAARWGFYGSRGVTAPKRSGYVFKVDRRACALRERTEGIIIGRFVRGTGREQSFACSFFAQTGD
jgi:hypothetical protein